MRERASTVTEQFNLIAAEYDSGRRKFIPCFDEYYEKTTDFVASILKNPRRIADLGAGTGLLTMYYYRHFQTAEYILVDAAEEMLSVARKRFSGLGNIVYQVWDYSRKLPEGPLDLVISALSIHHMETEQKMKVFRDIRQKLPSGNWFVNYDQFCGNSPEMSEILDRYWLGHLSGSGLSDGELALWRERRKLDRECSVKDELVMLEQCGFRHAECIYRSGKFAVIAAQA